MLDTRFWMLDLQVEDFSRKKGNIKLNIQHLVSSRYRKCNCRRLAVCLAGVAFICYVIESVLSGVEAETFFTVNDDRLAG